MRNEEEDAYIMDHTILDTGVSCYIAFPQTDSAYQSEGFWNRIFDPHAMKTNINGLTVPVFLLAVVGLLGTSKEHN